jgi:hypothetical protein
VFALTVALVPPALAASPESDRQDCYDMDFDFELICGYAILDFDNEIALLFFSTDYDTHWKHYLGIYRDNPNVVNLSCL